MTVAEQPDDDDIDALFAAYMGDDNGPTRPHLRAIGPNDPGPQRPEIIHNGRQLGDITRQALTALEQANTPPTLFVRSGQPARIRTDETGRPIVEPLRTDTMRHHLAKAADWYRATKDAITATPPPLDIATAMLALEHWPLPALAGIVEAPVIRPDGTFHLEHGYDPQTRLYHWHNGNPYLAVPETPTAAERTEAVAVIDDLLADFPFDSQADRANAWGMILTPLVRPITGHAMMALIDAPEPGTGKGLLVGVTSRIATGRSPALMPMPDDDVELEKKITALIESGATIIPFDNVEGMIRSHVLAAALTSDTWAGRTLGKTQIVNLPNRATWIANGNNIDVGGDLARRCYRIRLDARQAQPWKRTGFRHTDLEGHVAANRTTILHALCVIVRAWWAAGQPPPIQPANVGTATRWAHTIGGILDHAGIVGWLTNLDQFHAQADADAQTWLAWLTAWHDWKPDGEEVTMAEVVAHMSDSQWGSAMRETIPDQVVNRWGTPSFGKVLGKAISARAGRHHGERGYRVTIAGRNSRNVTLYKVSTTYSDPGYGPDEKVTSGVRDSSTSTFPKTPDVQDVNPYILHVENSEKSSPIGSGNTSDTSLHPATPDQTEPPPTVTYNPWDDEEPF